MPETFSNAYEQTFRNSKVLESVAKEREAKVTKVLPYFRENLLIQ